MKNQLTAADNEPLVYDLEKKSSDSNSKQNEVPEISIQAMLKAGVHFGHRKSRWNPKMKPFIFGQKSEIHIIDLTKTLSYLKKALEFCSHLVSNGGKILFVGTMPQLKSLVAKAAQETQMPYVANRWLGGTLTNFDYIRKRVKYLIEQEKKLEAGEFERYTKFERGKIKKEIERMNEKMGGIKSMEKLPQAIFVCSAKHDYLAIKEARKKKISVIAITDTNADPDIIDYPIPGNDDAISSVSYILDIISDQIIKTKKAKDNLNKANADKTNSD